jgi:hypothetical protein
MSDQKDFQKRNQEDQREIQPQASPKELRLQQELLRKDKALAEAGALL